MSLTEHEIGAFLVVLARVGGLVATAPVVGDGGVSSRAKLVLVLALSLAITANRPGVAYADVIGIVPLELGVGLLTGLTARFVLVRAQVAGQLIGLSLGLGFAAEYDARAGESAGTVATLLSTLAGLAFLAGGGLEAIARSAASTPATTAQLAMLGPTLLAHGTSAMTHGLSLAAPIVLATLVANLGLAVLGRAAPSINVFSVSLAAVLLVGGVALCASATSVFGGVAGTAQLAIDALTP